MSLVNTARQYATRQYATEGERWCTFMPDRIACSSGSRSKLPLSLSFSNWLYIAMPDLPCYACTHSSICKQAALHHGHIIANNITSVDTACAGRWPASIQVLQRAPCMALQCKAILQSSALRQYSTKCQQKLTQLEATTQKAEISRASKQAQ